jgi:hypothetical protein
MIILSWWRDRCHSGRCRGVCFDPLANTKCRATADRSRGGRMCATAPTAPVPAAKLWPRRTDDGLPRALRSAVVGVPAGRARADTRHDRRGHDLPASASDSSRARPAPEHQPCVSILALAHHRDGDEGVGGRPPQASRPMRNTAGPAQPPGPRHRASAVGRRLSLRARITRPRHGRTIRSRHAERLD